MGDALDDAFGRRNVQLAAAEVVEEEDGFGALNENVVHAHRDQVLPHGIVAAELKGEHEFRAHAVGARDEHRIFVVLADFKKGAEAADAV